jgi:hypothetical protein
MDRMPTNPEVLEDYGFNRCAFPEKSMLLGSYQGLTMLPRWSYVITQELHQQRLSGDLVEAIIKAYEERSQKGARVGYFPLFLKNRYILAGRPGRKG